MSERDLFVLQRTVVPAGQSWLYQLQTPNQPSALVQVQMWITPTLVPHEVIESNSLEVPALLHHNLTDLGLVGDGSGYEADQEGTGSDMTGAIYGD